MANDKYNDYTLLFTEIDCNETAKLFKKIKEKRKINTSINFKTFDLPSNELLKTDNFMDKIHYYRKLKNISKRYIADAVGIDDQSYIDYENKLNQLSNPYLAEKFIKVLEIENELELPEYYKFMMKYPYKKIVKYIKENFEGPTEFSRKSKINLGTIRSWIHSKKEMNISLESYKKLYEFWIKENKKI